MKRERYPTRRIRLVGTAQLLNLQTILSQVPIDAERPLVVTIAEEIKARKPDQNALMWAGPLKDISEQAYVGGRTYSAEIWAEQFKREFLPDAHEEGITRDGYQKWALTPMGHRVLIGSTTQLTVKGFALYLQQVEAFGAGLGVMFHERPAQ